MDAGYGAAKGRGPVDLTLTGLDELLKALDEITAEDGPKGINSELRKLCKAACKEILLPAVLNRLSIGPGRMDKGRGGHLADQIKIRAVKRRKGRVGYWIGFPDDLFKGPTYYAGFIEFGWDHVNGTHIEADSFLRDPLYQHKEEIIAVVNAGMTAYVTALNNAA